MSFLFYSFDSGVDSVYDEEESEPVSVRNPLSPKSDQHQISLNVISMLCKTDSS